MTTITLPDDVPVDQALRACVEYGLSYDHRARTLVPRAQNPGAGRDHIRHPPYSGVSACHSSNRPAPASEGVA